MQKPNDNEFLQAILQQSRNFVFSVDRDLVVRTVNYACTNTFYLFDVHVRVGEFFPHCLEGFPEQERKDKIENIHRAMNGERFSTLESWKQIYYQTEYTPLIGKECTIIGVVCVGRVLDTWDVKEAQEVCIDETEREFFWPHVVVAGRDIEGRSFARQSSWESFTGQTFEEYTGYGWINAHRPDFRNRIWKMWKAVSACKRRPRAFSFMSPLWNAKLAMYRYTLVHATPQFDMQGNLAYWNCAGIDIHDLRKLQEDLALATQRLNVILEAGQVGTWDWDLATGEMKTYTTLCRTFGRDITKPYRAEELMEQIVDREPVEAAIRQTIETGSPYEVEFQVRWPDGSLHWMGSRGVLYSMSDGRESLISANWDMTLRKQMEEDRVRFLKREEEIRSSKQAEEFERKRAEEAEENQRRQEEFIDTVCHEIRNPLFGIYGGVHLATEELNSVMNDLTKFDSKTALAMENIKAFMNSMLKCAEQQKVILDDVLDMSKIQNNKIQLVAVPFQLSACLELVVDMFRSRAQEKNLKLEANFPQDEVFIKTDMNRLQQVIINLVSNAVKFTHQGSVNISANVHQINHQLVLEVQVQDTGIGMSQDEIPLLFDRFSQVGNHKRTQYGGSGLGLAISKSLVEAMGGAISVASTLNCGTTFKFHIKVDPVDGSDISRLLQHRDEADQGDLSNTRTSLNILVVDDNSLNQKILASYLQKANHIVQLASDGLEAVQKAASQHFNIILMDIEMPKMNGLEATAAIRQREKELHIRSVIIGLSGNARKEKIDAALESGMDCYLTKPYHKDEIMKVISKHGCTRKARPRVHKQSLKDLQRVCKQPRIM